MSKIKLDIHCIKATNLLGASHFSHPRIIVQFYLKKLGETACATTHIIENTSNPVWDDHLSLMASDLSDILIVHIRNCEFPFDKLIDTIELPLSDISPINPIIFDNDVKLNGQNAGHFEFHVYCVDEKEEEETNNPESYLINLSLKEIDNILSTYNSDEFIFYMANHKTVKCNKIIADLISPKIAYIHKCDPTFNSYDLEFADYRLLEKLIFDENKDYNIFHYQSINFNKNEFDAMIKIAESLGNIDLYCQLTERTEIDVNNVVPVLIHKLANKGSTESKSIEREINFIAQNFSEISQSQLMELDYDTLNMIFSLDSFHINSEDELFELVYQLIEQDYESGYLLENVQFEYLSPEKLKKYLSLLNIDNMNASLWKRICKRLLSVPPRPMIESPRRSNQIVKIDFDNKDQFNGIFRYLNDKCKGNAHLEKLIEITSSGDKLNKCYQIIDKNWNNRWFTKNCHSWWMVDFKDMFVSLTGYSLKTYIAGDTGYPHLQSWIIEGSNDKEQWDKIDKQDPNTYLKGPGYSKMFQFSRPSIPYRYIRLMSKGPDHEGEDSFYLLLSSIEFFGTLYS